MYSTVKHIKLFEEFSIDVNENYSINTVTLEGEVQLYHYTKDDLGDKAILSPEETVSKRLSWSMREYKRSDVPRVFYYLNLKKTEYDIVSLSKFLYTGFVNGNDIIKLADAINAYNYNPQELESLYPDAYNSIKEFMDKGGINYDILFEDIKKYFKGAYYKFGNDIEVVILFQPLKVFKIDFIKNKN